MKVPTTFQAKKKKIREIAEQLKGDRKTMFFDYDEMPYVQFSFEESPEGVGIGIENDEITGNYFVIIAWPYTEASEESLKDMEEFVEKALELIPNAVLCMHDDPWDYNPNSGKKAYRNAYNDYHYKSSSEGEWKKHFEKE